MNIHRVETLDLTGLQPYRTLRRPADHHRMGIFVAEGEKIVRRLLESPLEVVSVLLTPEWLQTHGPLIDSRAEAPEVFVAPKKLVETIVGFNLHQGIMAVGRVPAPPPLEQFVSHCSPPRLLVALDGLTNAENLGVLVRNCAAFGVQGLIVGETSSSPYLRRAVRNSMGAIFKLPVVHSESLTQTIRLLQERHDTGCFAADPGSKAREPNFKGNACIIFGSEGSGITPEVLQTCREKVAVPMRNDVDSLNVASASAVLLYEVARQRGSL